MRRFVWLLPFALVLAWPAGSRADDVQTTSYARGMTSRFREAHLVEVPLVAQGGGE